MWWVPAALMALLFAQAPAPQNGGVEGMVVRAGTNEPIEGVEVRIAPVTPQPGRDQSFPMTGRDGRFSVSNLAPGRYIALANKSGYASQIYGAPQPGIAGLAGVGTREEDLAAVGALIDVMEGQIVRNIVIRMIPSGTVSGRVLGTNGEPLVSMQVDLIPVNYDANGRRNLMALTQVDTDDRGEYRLFNVEPGRYYISARWSAVAVARQETNSELRTINAADSNGQRYAPAYYPSSSNLAGASIIEVKPGEAVAGMNITMRPPSTQPRRNIRGRVVDSVTGQAPPLNSGPAFLLIPRDVELLPSLPAWDPHLMADGSFEVRDVAEGSYWFVVRFMSVRTTAGTSSRTSVVQLDLFGGDMERLSVNLLPAASVNGRITLDGAPWGRATADGLVLRMNATRIGAFSMNASPNPLPASFQPNGTFTIGNVSPGNYDLAFVGLPPDAYVAEARYGGTDALAQKIAIYGASSDQVEIAVSTKGGQLTGVVTDRDRRPVPSVDVVLIPEGPIQRPDRYKTVKTDANGRYLLRGIAPGDYRIYSWESLERFRYFDREFVREFERLGKSVRIAEAEKGTLDLDIIPVPR